MKTSQNLRGRAGSSVQNWYAAPEAVGMISEAARRAPRAQRFRGEAGRIRLRLISEFHRTQVPLLDLARRKAGCAGPCRSEHRRAVPVPNAVRAAARRSAAHPHCRASSAAACELRCQRASSDSSADLDASEELRGRAGSSSSERHSSFEDIGGSYGAARRVSGMQRCR